MGIRNDWPFWTLLIVAYHEARPQTAHPSALASPPAGAVPLWSLRLSDLERRFVCTVCGHRGADVRPLFEPARMGTDA